MRKEQSTDNLTVQFPYMESDKLISGLHKKKTFVPDNDFVISRNLSGQVLSRYGDLSYNLSPYCTTNNGKNIIPFNSIEGESYQIEARWLWFIIYRFGKGRNNNNLSVSVLYGRFIGFVKPLCAFAKKQKVTAKKVLENEKLLIGYIHANNSGVFNRQVLPTLKLYLRLSNKIGLVVSLSKIAIKTFEKRRLIADGNKNQTELIPPRIYKNWLGEAWKVVDEFEKKTEGFTNLLYKLVNESSYLGIKYATKIRAKVWSKWLKELNLLDISKSKGFLTDRRQFTVYLSDFMNVCKGLIHFYSGMRDDEVLSLNYHCLQLDTVNNRKRARLIGNTTKYIGNNKQELWVTTEEIERVIKLLQAIVEPIASTIEVSVKLDSKKPCPLFLTTNYLISKGFRDKYPLGKVRSWRYDINSLSNNSLINKEVIRVTEEDIQYLEKFDPERDWRQSQYSVGEIWHLKTHQFRRSLAVYSAQSGLVSIGSLQKQLKHLCREISFYYSNGAERTRGIFNIDSSNHMAYEFKKQKPIADYTAWVWQILFSDETLDGINGRVIERTIKGNTPERRALILQDRKKTIKQFKDGQRAFTGTPLGGCETTTPCNKKLMHSITACIDCDKADLKPSKVKRTIDSMTIFVNSLPPDSVEYRTEHNELDQLVKLQRRMGKNDVA
jgi:integrase